MSALTVTKASTAMAACVSLVPLDLNRRTIRVAAIYVSHSARTSTALTAYHVSVAVPAVSPSPIALDASHALLWAMLSCLRRAMRVCNVVPAVNRMPPRLHASHACHIRTRSGTALMAHRACDARLASNPTRNARAAMLAWVSTRLMVVSAWTVSQDTSHLLYRVPLAARVVVTLAQCISRTQDGSVAHAL